MQLGEPSISADIYLSALLILGVLDFAAPALPDTLTDLKHLKVRVKLMTKNIPIDDNDF